MSHRFTIKEHVAAVVSVLVISFAIHGLMTLGSLDFMAADAASITHEQQTIVLPPVLR